MHDAPEHSASPFGAHEIALLLERGWKRVVLGGILGLGIAVGAALLMEPRFVSSAKLVFEPGALPSQYVRTTVSERGAEDERVFRQRVTSDAVLREAIDRTRALVPSERRMSESAHMQQIRAKLGLDVATGSRSSGTQIIEFSYMDSDPTVAHGMLAAVIGSFTTLETETRTGEARSTERFLAAEVETLGGKLDELEKDLLAARAKLPRDLLFGSKSTPAPRSNTQADAVRRLTDELAKAESLYTAEHPTIQNLRSQIQSMRSRMRRQVTSKGGELKHLAEYDAVYAEHARLQASYEKLVSRHLEALVAANLEVERAGKRFRELQAPTVPNQAAFPSPVLFGSAGALAGSGLVLGLMLASIWWQPRYGNVATLEDSMSVPVIASIPRVDEDTLVTEPPPEGVSKRLIAVTAPESTAAEQYRAFIPHYLDEKQPRVVLVTSSSRGDGKSMTSSNVAATLARELSRDVLLVDADLRRPSAHRMFGMSRRPGLADVLAGRASLDETVKRTEVPRLSFLPAGHLTSIRVARFADARFMQFLDAVRGRYGTIVLDTPPLLPVADARLLGRIAEMVVLVVRANVTPRTAVERCLDTLGDVSGVIFNDVSAGSYRRAYHSYPTEDYGSEA